MTLAPFFALFPESYVERAMLDVTGCTILRVFAEREIGAQLAVPRRGRYISANSPNPALEPRWRSLRGLGCVGSTARAGRMARQFIYHMQGLSKTYPGNRKILENINLSFYPDAKIGVLGVNGSGKSTLLRIMAGLDKEFAGDAWIAEGARVGYLEQEPQLDPPRACGRTSSMALRRRRQFWSVTMSSLRTTPTRPLTK
jgi:ABC-type glutathione transport system ATPase component